MCAVKRSFKGPRFTWAMASFYTARLQKLLFEPWLTGSSKTFFGGSFVRRCPEVGDIDVAVYLDQVTPELPIAFVDQFYVETLISGSKVARYVVDFSSMFPGSSERKFQLDLWFTTDLAQWGPLCMFVAGNGKLNVLQRVKAAQRGCQLSQYGVTRGGESMGSFPTEESVYHFFGWPWLPYEKRELK